MISKLIQDIEQSMLEVLDYNQMEQLHVCLEFHLTKQIKPIQEFTKCDKIGEKDNIVSIFLTAKHIEGCSNRTIRYYRLTIQHMNNAIDKQINYITTDDLRKYLENYQQSSKASNVTVDNVRRVLSSYFSWLEAENYIIRNPIKRIHKVKTKRMVKETYTDEMIELMRDHCKSLRDLAIVDLLSSTGMRVGELVQLNIEDIDFINRECVVLGKGNKERIVYFDARTKLHLSNYLESRTDSNHALFVTLLKPFHRLKISGVEIRLRQLGQSLQLPKVYPHKFRRTLATKAIDRGMPIEQVQILLGHSKIDTTLEYAMVEQSNVKLSHRKYIS